MKNYDLFKELAEKRSGKFAFGCGTVLSSSKYITEESLRDITKQCYSETKMPMSNSVLKVAIDTFIRINDNIMIHSKHISSLEIIEE
jgi:hypothetical protein